MVDVIEIFDLEGQLSINNTWSEVSIDIAWFAFEHGLDLTDTFVVKFQQYDNYPIPTDGFAFDDISVVGYDCSPPYVTGFEEGDLDACWTTESDNLYGRIEVTDQYAAPLGRWLGRFFIFCPISITDALLLGNPTSYILPLSSRSSPYFRDTLYGRCHRDSRSF